MQMRQGDVFLEKVNQVPEQIQDLESAKDVDGSVTLAEGEATGHRHRIKPEQAEEVSLYINGDWDENEMFLIVDGDEPVDLVHEEHGTLTLEPGAYRSTIQREWTGERERRVLD